MKNLQASAIDKSGKVLFLFYGPVSRPSVFDTKLEALFHLLKTYYNGEFRSHRLAIFLDSLNLVQHINSHKCQSNGPVWSWAHSVCAIYIESNINNLADFMAKEGRK